MTIPFGALNRLPLSPGLGRLVKGNTYAAQIESALDGEGGLAQVTTISIGGAENASLYSILVTSAELGISALVSFTTASTSVEALRNGLIAAWNASPYAGSIATVSAASASIVVTGNLPGAAFTLSFPSNPTTDLTQSTGQAATAYAAYLYGRFVQPLSWASSTYQLNQAYIGHLAAVSGPTINLALTYATTGNATVAMFLQGPDGNVSQVPATWAYGGNLAAALAAGKVAIDAALATAGISAVAVVASPDLDIALPVGYRIVSVDASVEGVGNDIVATSDAGDAPPASCPIVMDPGTNGQYVGSATTGVTNALPGQPIALLTGGDQEIYVEDPGAAITYGSVVYVESAAGANNGRPYTVASATRFAHPTARWVGADPALAGFAVLTLE